MDAPPDQDSPVPPIQHSPMTPAPDRVTGLWRAKLEKIMGDDPEERWGSRLIRVSSDMILVCDENLEILFHNRAFLKGIGYQSGTFIGHSLMEFFPAADQSEANRAFDGLRNGPAAGLRIEATFLTTRGDRQFDARITRSRCKTGGMYLYVIARDALKRVESKPVRVETAPIDPILNGLPLAAFRTDRKLRITHVCGSLWDEMGVSAKQLIGGDLSNPHCHVTPHFLHGIDFCDTMAGLTMHADISWKEESYEITIEPFINKGRKVIGTVGMIRQAKQTPEVAAAEHLQFPNPQDYTQALKPMGDLKKTRKIEIGPPQDISETAPTRPVLPDIHHDVPAVAEYSTEIAATNEMPDGFQAPSVDPQPDLSEEGEREKTTKILPANTGDAEPVSEGSRAIEIELPNQSAQPANTQSSEAPNKVREIEIGPPVPSEPAPADEFSELSEAAPAAKGASSVTSGPATSQTFRSIDLDAAEAPVDSENDELLEVRRAQVAPPSFVFADKEEPEAPERADELPPASSGFDVVEHEEEPGEVAMSSSEDISVLRAKIQPRRLAPSDVLNGSGEDESSGDPIVLAN